MLETIMVSEVLSSPYFYILQLVLLGTLVLRILSGAEVNRRFFGAFVLQAALATAWLALETGSSGLGAVLVGCLAGVLALGLDRPRAPLVISATAFYGCLLWWTDIRGGDVPLFPDWFNALITTSGAFVLRAFLDDARENRWMDIRPWLGAVLTLAAITAAWVPAWSTAAVPLLLTAFIGLGAQLVKTARERE